MQSYLNECIHSANILSLFLWDLFTHLHIFVKIIKQDVFFYFIVIPFSMFKFWVTNGINDMFFTFFTCGFNRLCQIFLNSCFFHINITSFQNMFRCFQMFFFRLLLLLFCTSYFVNTRFIALKKIFYVEIWGAFQSFILQK